jgi:hypothetical protein
MAKHEDYKFSVTIHSDNIAVIGCLRALTQVSQREGDVRIPSGGTKRPDWERDGHQVTFRFTSPEYRHGFLALATEVLRDGLWSEVRRSDNDQASPQSE